MTTTTGLFVLALLGSWLVSEEDPPRSAAAAAAPALAAPPASPEEPSRAQAAPPSEPVWLSFRRLPDAWHMPIRPKDCTSPPPGGRWQLATIEAARRHACGESLESWRLGMEESEDHCSLARAIWFCFGEADRRPLEGATPGDFDSFLPYLVHLEGPSLGAPSSPASGGLELRLEVFEADPRFRSSAIDLLGATFVAIQLTEEIQFEIDVALAIAKTPDTERTERMERVWARRAFVISNALHGETGLLLQSKLPDHYASMRAAFVEAMRDAPSSVQRALVAAWENHQ